MDITFQVDNVDLTSEIGHRYNDDGDRVPRTLGEAVATQITRNLMTADDWASARKLVPIIRESEIRAAVQAEIATAMTAPIQRTNTFGAPMGEPTTLTELVIAEAKSYLTRKVDDSYRSNGQTVVQKFIAEAVDKAIKKELAEAIADEKAKVVAAVRAKAADLIASAVREGVGR
ncbi:hypothetical protein FJK98_02250 [Micromonospora sp. HM134]|uniref:hypothetical protein n=1 Tax=Micromonospora sp. HM134 TaxID=2583243 RepID=UPI0011984A0C|nr:hypothetical protein [Micromonospora sp. HM134]QDY06126.1 hypothetical protein FJK98_02250 [Micromonospora sp. HM134]